MNSTDLLKSVRDDVVQCTQCDLHKTRTNPVVGSGNHNANVLMISGSPSEEEDKSATPFSGPAGNILRKMLASINMKKEDVYLCTAVKCMDATKKDPTEEQRDECLQYLVRQIEAIKPTIIVCFGNYAMRTVMSYLGLESKIEPISRIHGNVYDVDPALGFGYAKVMPIYHPAAVLHNPPLRVELEQDFKKLKAAIGKSVSSSS